MWGGKCIAKQLDCTICIKSTQNNGIRGIHFTLHMTFSRRSSLASKRKPGLINISGMNWTTWKSHHSNQQMPYESSSLNLISVSAMIVALKLTHISLEPYTTVIFSNVFFFFWHIYHFRCTSTINRFASLTLRVFESTVIWARAISGGIHRINFRPERELCQSYVHLTRLT